MGETYSNISFERNLRSEKQLNKAISTALEKAGIETGNQDCFFEKTEEKPWTSIYCKQFEDSNISEDQIKNFAKSVKSLTIYVYCVDDDFIDFKISDGKSVCTVYLGTPYFDDAPEPNLKTLKKIINNDVKLQRFYEILFNDYDYVGEAVEALGELFGFCRDDVECFFEEMQDKNVSKLTENVPSFVSEFNKYFGERLKKEHGFEKLKGSNFFYRVVDEKIELICYTSANQVFWVADNEKQKFVRIHSGQKAASVMAGVVSVYYSPDDFNERNLKMKCSFVDVLLNRMPNREKAEDKWGIVYYTPGDVNSYYKAIEELYEKTAQVVFDYFSYVTLDAYVKDFRIGKQLQTDVFVDDQIALYKTKDPESICREIYVDDLTNHARSDYGVSFEEYKVLYKKRKLKPLYPGLLRPLYPPDYEDYLRQEYYAYYKFRCDKKLQEKIFEECERNKSQIMEILANGIKR